MTVQTRISRLVRRPIALIGATLARGERGAAIVEMALVLPLLLALLMGILVYGQYFMLAHNVQQAANDGARAAMRGQLGDRSAAGVQALAGNRWLDRATNELRKFMRLLRGRQLNWPGRLQASIAEHRALMDALMHRDAERAERVMHDHLMAQLTALQALRSEEERQGAPPASPGPMALD